MDYFSLCLNGLCLTGQGIIHLVFIGHFTGKQQKIRHFAAYLLLLYTIERLFIPSALSGVLAIGVQLLVLYGMSRFALGNQRSVSWAAAIFAIYICQLSFGIVNSVEAMIFPHAVGNPLLYPLVFFATLAAFLICACCYAAALKFLSLTEERQMPYVEVLLFPGLFFFAAELYIIHTSYSALPSYSVFHSSLLTEAGKHTALLLLQVSGLGAMLCTLCAYQHLCRNFQTQAALIALTQAAQAQKVYIAEAQMRYEQTASFRHDIKNHLSVLDGLLSSGKMEESRSYLQKLETVSLALSFPYQTGNSVVDILLREKLRPAVSSGIEVTVSLLLPRSCGIDDFDLCVIFANALDNAINACQLAMGKPSIHISGEQQGDFYMLSFENTCSDGPQPPMGTGLSNIKSVAEKYHGAMLTEKDGQRFSLNVLLNIPSHPESTSWESAAKQQNELFSDRRINL